MLDPSLVTDVGLVSSKRPNVWIRDESTLRHRIELVLTSCQPVVSLTFAYRMHAWTFPRACTRELTCKATNTLFSSHHQEENARLSQRVSALERGRSEFEKELQQRDEVSLCLRGFAFRRICAYGFIPCMCTYKYILRYRSFWSTHVTANDSGRPWRVQCKNRCARADVTSGKMSHAGMHLSVCQHPHMMQTGGRPA